MQCHKQSRAAFNTGELADDNRINIVARNIRTQQHRQRSAVGKAVTRRREDHGGAPGIQLRRLKITRAHGAIAAAPLQSHCQRNTGAHRRRRQLANPRRRNGVGDVADGDYQLRGVVKRIVNRHAHCRPDCSGRARRFAAKIHIVETLVNGMRSGSNRPSRRF